MPAAAALSPSQGAAAPGRSRPARVGTGVPRLCPCADTEQPSLYVCCNQRNSAAERLHGYPLFLRLKQTVFWALNISWKDLWRSLCNPLSDLKGTQILLRSDESSFPARGRARAPRALSHLHMHYSVRSQAYSQSEKRVLLKIRTYTRLTVAHIPDPVRKPYACNTCWLIVLKLPRGGTGVHGRRLYPASLERSHRFTSVGKRMPLSPSISRHEVGKMK